MKKILHAFAFVTTFTAATLLAKPGVVKTVDGQTYNGEVEEKVETVNVTIRGIATAVPRTKIASITYPEAGGYDKEFNDKLAKLDKKDAAGRLALGREA